MALIEERKAGEGLNESLYDKNTYNNTGRKRPSE